MIKQKNGDPSILSTPISRRFAAKLDGSIFTGTVDIDPKQIEDLKSFEQGLARQPLYEDGGLTIIDVLREGTLGSSEAINITSEQQIPVVFLQYFLSDDFKRISDEDHSTADDVKKWLAISSLDSSNKEELLKLAVKSQDYAIKAFANGYSDVYDDYSLVNIDPSGTISQFTEILRARDKVHEKRDVIIKSIQEEDEKDGSVAYKYAQLMVLDVYVAKIKDVMASYIPRLLIIADQALHASGPYKELVKDINKLLKEVGIVDYQASEDNSVIYKEEIFRRMDEIRNGAASNGSSVDESLFKTVDTNLEQTNPLLSSIEKHIFETKEVTPGIVINIINQVFEKLEIDDWSVEINPGKATFQVLGEENKFYVPRDPITLKRLVTVGVHEFMHVIQSINDSESPLQIAKVKGRRASGIREAMGKMVENKILKLLFGESPKPAATYARAIQELHQGNKPSEAAMSFDEQLAASSKRLAAGRVIRLLGMGINTQPMVYAEGSRIAYTLKHVQEGGYTGIDGDNTSFDIPDQIRLARVGLLPVPKISLDSMRVLVYFMELLQQEDEYSNLVDWSSIIYKCINNAPES